MDDINQPNSSLDKILSLSNEELEKIFSELSLTEVEDLVQMLAEEDSNE